jgi:histidinol phosphatase-like PHP family hydrolase
MKHPLVTLITHPTNDSCRNDAATSWTGSHVRDGDRNGTVMEVDGAPSHLDMDGALARRAIAAGVSVTIDSDSHRRRCSAARWILASPPRAADGWSEARREHVLRLRFAR